MSPWQIAKLWTTRGMHLDIILQIYAVRWPTEWRKRFEGIKQLVKEIKQDAVQQRLHLVQRSMERGKACKEREDIPQAIVEYANGIMYTLPWFDECGHQGDDIDQLIQLCVTCILTMLTSAADSASP
jgi:hypothetical protein